MADGGVVVPKEAIDRGAVALDDLLTMLGVDPEQRPEHGGSTTAEVLAAASAKAAAPLILAAELERLVDETDWAWAVGSSLRARAAELRAVVLRGDQT